ncbi:hypothetical protein PBY51_010401 [Eleginops maclovinus]|uniref:Uncharacterized protein n=1 Tax=Eleginops maclovinus TaxID=56733 RepID=A0AAN7XAL4_ELEMC|nr:hypothetical protein PBY51_010401 [Eleginops maclovinus]
MNEAVNLTFETMLGSIMVFLKWLLFLSAFLQGCSAHDITCTVVPDGTLTKYSISDDYRVSDAEASGCYYSWANASDYVLANEEGKNPEMVLRTSVNDLLMFICFDMIIFKRVCKEGTVYNVDCITNCTQSSPRKSEGHNVIVLVAVLVGILVLVGLCVLLCCKFKEKMSRFMYASVKMRMDDLKADNDVEAGNE